MKSTTTNNRNQKTSNLPLSIGSGVRAAAKVGAAILGFHLFENGFLWVVLALLFCSNLLRGIFSCLLSFVVLIGLFSFLFTPSANI